MIKFFISYCKLILDFIVNCNFHCIAGRLCCKLTLSVIIIIIIIDCVRSQMDRVRVYGVAKLNCILICNFVHAVVHFRDER